MEPTLTSVASTSTVISVLQALIDAAVAALPAAHRQPPIIGAIVKSMEAALQQLQDWAFPHRFAVAIESAKAKRVSFQCTHRHKETRNTRDTAEGNCKRVETQTQTRGCLFGTPTSRARETGKSPNLSHWFIPPIIGVFLPRRLCDICFIAHYLLCVSLPLRLPRLLYSGRCASVAMISLVVEAVEFRALRWDNRLFSPPNGRCGLPRLFYLSRSRFTNSDAASLDTVSASKSVSPANRSENLCFTGRHWVYSSSSISVCPPSSA
jgi:hypothetical protein